MDRTAACFSYALTSNPQPDWACPLSLRASLAREPRSWPLWTFFAALVVAVRFNVSPERGNVYHIYLVAARHWLAGGEIYDGSGFYYLQTAALPFVPLVELPCEVGGAIWRLATLSVFILGTWRLLRDCGAVASPSQRFPLVSLIVAALSWSCARHGQMTLAMAGLMMMAVSSLQRGRWWSGAIAVAGAVALKPLAVVLLLVAPFLYPRVILPLSVASLGLFALPFALHDSGYVYSQYSAVPEMLRQASAREFVGTFYHLPGLLDSFGLTLTAGGRLALRSVMAFATLGLCFYVHRRVPRDRQGLFLFSITSVYILLFGSGTERNTYTLMMPALAVLLVHGLETGRRGVAMLLGGMALATLLLSSTLSRTFPDTPLAMLKVWVCLVFLVVLLRDAAASRRKHTP